MLDKAARRQRDILRELLAGDCSTDGQRAEVEAHFRNMPERYWAGVDAATVRWHLGLVRTFLQCLDDDGEQTLVPVVRWRHFPDRHVTEVGICTWDRPGLLARVAQAFASVGINILHAEVYRRSDNVMLALFRVADRQLEFVPRERLLEEMVKTLAMLSGAEPEPVPSLPPPASGAGEAWVECDTQGEPEHTVLMVEARDRVGLLHIIFREINTAGLRVELAIVTTENEVAGDVFFLTDAEGHKITDVICLEALCRKLRQALAL